jgi:hypothetical protein
MSQIAVLRCRCGKVEGRVADASGAAVNRIVCYCDDCQAFAHQLGRADVLDVNGGSDIVQVAPAALEFVLGTEHIAGLRLGPKGLYRFHTTCCNTPLGNTVGTAIPFVGIVAQAFGDADVVFGPPIGGIQGKFAVGTPPEGTVKPNLRLLARAIRKVLGWRFGGKALPHPFFDSSSRAPRYGLRVLTPAEREALRPLCGPMPAKGQPARA